MECEHKFVECVCINCGLETKHEFRYIQEYIVCINCGLESDTIITPERVVPFSYTKERPWRLKINENKSTHVTFTLLPLLQ